MTKGNTAAGDKGPSLWRWAAFLAFFAGVNLFLAWIVTDRFSLTTRQQVIWAGAFLAALAAGQVALLVGWWRGGGARRIRARRGKHEPRGPTR